MHESFRRSIALKNPFMPRKVFPREAFYILVSFKGEANNLPSGLNLSALCKNLTRMQNMP
jgi:hypothetical protein